MNDSDMLSFGCQCGRVTGTLELADPPAIRCKCYCQDCQAQARHFGLEDRLMDADGGIEILQFAAGNVHMNQGVDQIRALKLIPKKSGVVRFYAGCCDTPLFSTPPSEGWPIIGLPVASIQADAADRDRRFGDIKYVPFRSGQVGKGTPAKGLFRHVLAVVKLMMSAKRKGKAESPVWRDGKLIAEPHLLTEAERAKAYATP